MPEYAKSQRPESQLWMDYNITIPVNNKFSYGGDIGLRGFISNDDWNQIIIRPTARYRFNSIVSVGGGVAGFLRFNEVDDNIYEFRIQEEVNIQWPDFNILSFFYRIRFDQQFFYFDNLPEERGGRVRYLVGIAPGDILIFGDKKPVYLHFFWEGFKTLGESGIDNTFVNQDRWTGILGYKITEKVRIEINYFDQRKKGAADPGFQTTEHIVRLRFFHRMD